MELLYIYFNSHYLFAGQSFNFGGELRFSYDKETQTLDVSENPFYIKGFYNQEHGEKLAAYVNNVTGIIAENGAGKTTLLNLIRDNFPPGKGGIYESMIFAYKDNDQLYIYYYDDIVIVKHNLNQFQFIIKKIKRTKKKEQTGNPAYPELEYTTYPKVNCFNHTEFIYFSNIFDGQDSKETKGMRDVSTNYLVRQDLVDDILNKRISRDYKHNEVETFLMHDIQRQIGYINDYRGAENLPVRLPEYLIVSTRREYFDINSCFDSSDIQTLDEFDMTKVARCFFDIAKLLAESTKDWKVKAEIYFVKAVLMNYLYEISTNFKNVRSHVNFDIDLSQFVSLNNFSEESLVLLNEMESQARRFSVNMNEDFYTSLEHVKTFIKVIPEFIHEDNIINGDGTSFWLNIRKEPNAFENFHRLYSTSYGLKPYLGFKWSGMSSGENAFLNILSRFHSVVQEKRRFDNGALPRSLVILIDEGDTYLHPTWQKKFLKEMLDHLPIIFAPLGDGNRTLQLIFTTNSPIPATDLPNSSIIFLEKKDGKAVVKDSLEDKKLTFGANINTLLSDSFFLKDGALGDFAKSKINNIIEILQGSGKLIDEEKEFLEKTINIIGEPVVKNKLLQMLSDRMTVNLLGMNERLAKLEKEIKELKEKSN